MQLLAFGLVVTASLLMVVTGLRPGLGPKLDVNINDEAEKFNLDKCRGLIKEYVDRVNEQSLTIVLDKVTKWNSQHGELYLCDYTVKDAASKLKCGAYVSFRKNNQEPTFFSQSPCYL